MFHRIFLATIAARVACCRFTVHAPSFVVYPRSAPLTYIRVTDLHSLCRMSVFSAREARNPQVLDRAASR